MKRITSLLISLLILFFSIDVFGYEFNTDDDWEGWTPCPRIDPENIQVKDGKLIVLVNANTNDPFMNGPVGPWDANDITGVLMKMHWSVDGTSFGGPALYFFPASGGHGSVPYEPPADPNAWKVVLVDLLGVDSWSGQISRIRFDMADGVQEDYTVEVDWIRLESLYLDNETFEWTNMKGWEVREGSPDDFNDLEQETVYSGNFALKITGIGSNSWHALKQPIKGGPEFAQGDRVAVMGAAKIPADSWDDDSRLWARVTEKLKSGEEHHTPLVDVSVFDEWFEFRAEKQLMYDPSERESLEVHLYSKNPEGKSIYLDDIFVEVLPPLEEESGEHEYWRWLGSSWEFNTPGETEGWWNFDPERVTYFDVNDGALLLDLPGGTFDPYVFAPTGPYYASKIGGIVARMRFFGSEDDRNKPQHAVYWFPVEGGHGSRGYRIPVIGEWFVVYMDISKMWKGWINNFRFDFGHYDELVMVDIDWVRFMNEYITNNGFEKSLEPWAHQGAGDISAFSLATEQKVSGDTSLGIEGLGTDQYHCVAQDVEGWDRIPKGAALTLRGTYYVPTDTWVENSVIWFRIKEYDGKVENLTDSLTAPVLDAWAPFEYTLQAVYEPKERTTIQVQLFSKTPAGKMVYVDDVFLSVKAEEPVPEQEFTWPVNSVRLTEDQQITIDGQVSAEEYAGAQALIFNAQTLTAADPYFEGVTHAGQLHDQATETPLDDFNAVYYFMWDDTYFYAAVTVQDDDYSFVGPNPNSSDTLQFVFGQTPQEEATANMYIPTIAPDDGSGSPFAKNDFGGWITKDIMAHSDYAGSVDPATQDWAVEVRIPWSAMQGDFEADVFPPGVGDNVGFSLLGIDYDDGALSWFAGLSAFPWTNAGLQPMYFVERSTP